MKYLGFALLAVLAILILLIVVAALKAVKIKAKENTSAPAINPTKEEADDYAEKLSKITCPAYIVAGEYDIMWLSDTVFIHENIKDSKVAIIKGANHGSYISQDGKQAYVLARDFFAEL